MKGKLFFSNGLRSLPKMAPDCPILKLCWVFDNFILADKLFAKALQSLETCGLVNNDLCGKLVWSLELPQYHFLFLILVYSVAGYFVLILC